MLSLYAISSAPTASGPLDTSGAPPDNPVTSPVVAVFTFGYTVLGSVVSTFNFAYNILGSYTPVTIDASKVSANRKVVFPGCIKTVRF